MKNYDQYKLRQVGAENDDLTALKPYVLLDRATLLEDVVKFGFMCDWNDFKVASRLDRMKHIEQVHTLKCTIRAHRTSLHLYLIVSSSEHSVNF